jgi:hypothetical protein
MSDRGCTEIIAYISVFERNNPELPRTPVDANHQPGILAVAKIRILR